MNRIAKKLAAYMIQTGGASEDSFDYYEYCFEGLLSTAFHFSAILLVSIFANSFFETLSYLLGFVLLRRTAGGYHANTNFRCFLLMALFFAAFLSILSFLPPTVYISVSLCGVSFSTVIVLLFSPVEHENRPFTENEKKIFRRNSCGIAILLLIATLFFLIAYPSIFTNRCLLSYDIGYCFASISLAMARARNFYLQCGNLKGGE